MKSYLVHFEFLKNSYESKTSYESTT